MNYQRAYGILFNAITDAIDGLEHNDGDCFQIVHVIFTLKEAQRMTEEMYIDPK